MRRRRTGRGEFHAFGNGDPDAVLSGGNARRKRQGEHHGSTGSGLAVALLCAGAMAGPAPECPQRPAQVEAQVPPALYETGLLWRIDGQGGTVSHVYGTLHMDDPQVLDLPVEVIEVLSRSRALAVEVDLDAANERAYATAARAPEGTDLRAALGPMLGPRYALLAARQGVDADVAAGLKPWAALNLLARPPPQSGLVLDAALARRAHRLGRPVHALEPMAELIAHLDALPHADQLALLRDTICGHEELVAQWPAQRALYLQRDLGGLWRLNLAPAPDPGLQRRFLDALLYGRTQRMLERLAPLLAEGGIFVAIGALHLPGERGLLHLLRTHGYAITRVY
jgi:uncharacterized protein YbaP (TraB family)